MSILILFQSFKVMDEIIYHSDKTSKKKIVVNEKKIVLQTEEESVEKQNIEIDTLFASADKEKGLKLSKQCQACHDFSNNLKIKLGPPLWGVVGRDTAIIADFKYSKAFLNLKKTWSRQELFYFLVLDPCLYSSKCFCLAVSFFCSCGRLMFLNRISRSFVRDSRFFILPQFFFLCLCVHNSVL